MWRFGGVYSDSSDSSRKNVGGSTQESKKSVRCIQNLCLGGHSYHIQAL